MEGQGIWIVIVLLIIKLSVGRSVNQSVDEWVMWCIHMRLVY